MNRRNVLILILLAALLAACGSKGPLVMPDAQAKKKAPAQPMQPAKPDTDQH